MRRLRAPSHSISQLLESCAVYVKHFQRLKVELHALEAHLKNLQFKVVREDEYEIRLKAAGDLIAIRLEPLIDKQKLIATHARLRSYRIVEHSTPTGVPVTQLFMDKMGNCGVTLMETNLNVASVDDADNVLVQLLWPADNSSQE